MVTRILPTEADTATFAATIGKALKPGDVLLLEGQIGAGKSAFARALIRSLAGAEIEVPSPTFTLVQTYDLPIAEVWHCDLYRLSHPDEVFELGLDSAFDSAICLIEWPVKLGTDTPDGALTLHFSALPDHHSVSYEPSDAWAARLASLDD